MDTITAPVVPADWDALYDGFVGRLRRSGAGADAPGLYDRFEPFALPDSRGRYVSLKDRLADGPVVLSFMRGGFCPYCRAELQAWHDAIPRLEAVGGHFIAISAEVGGRAEETRCGLAPNAEMLCDVDHGLALSLGLAHPVGPDLHEGYRAHGLYLDEIYGDSGMLLPTPATFVIDSGGVVRYAFVAGLPGASRPDRRDRGRGSLRAEVGLALIAPLHGSAMGQATVLSGQHALVSIRRSSGFQRGNLPRDQLPIRQGGRAAFFVGSGRRAGVRGRSGWGNPLPYPAPPTG